MHEADRIRLEPCGCRYDVVTGLKTEVCVAHLKQEKQRKRSKYNNKKTPVDTGERVEVLDSGKEARRYQELMLLQKAGEIAKLERQVKIPIVINDFLVCEWRADFTYCERFSEGGEDHWRVIWEDTKGKKTDVYGLKKKLVWAVHGVEIRES